MAAMHPTLANLPDKYRRQAIVSPPPKSKSETPVYRNLRSNPDFSKPPMAIPPPDQPHLVSSYALFQEGKRKAGERAPFLGERFPLPDGKAGPFQFMSWKETEEKFLDCAAAILKTTGAKPHGNKMIGFFMNNNVQWFLADLACAASSTVSVTMYPTFEDPAIEYIVNLCEIPLVFLSPIQLPRLLALLPKLPTLRTAVVCASPFAPWTASPQEAAAARAAGVSLPTWDAFLASGRAARTANRTLVPQPPRSPDELYTLCFTSGTTGMPKGAMITHRNIVGAAIGVGATGDGLFDKDMVYLSYMPTAHIYERINVNMLAYYGARMGVFRGDTLHVFEDIQTLKPTYIPSVPRIFNRIVGQLKQAIAGLPEPARKQFEAGYEAKRRLLKENGEQAGETEWDRSQPVKNFRAVLGGNVRILISAAAPIAPDVLEFLRIVFGCTVNEAYGMTENTASSHILMRGDVYAPFGSSVGATVPHSEFKLVDVPEMNYFAQPRDGGNPKGEVWTRGPSTMVGYYKAPDKTAETLTSDGWLKTGDIGELLPNLTLKIIDRKKHIFKLSQGEYVAPERVETVYLRNPLVAQIFLHGDSLKSCLVAVVVPDPDAIKSVAAKVGAKGTSLPELCKDRKVCGEVLNQLVTAGKKEGLHGFEQPKAVHLHPDPFTVENGLLTPTQKAKRAELKMHFEKQLAAMYKEVDLSL